MSVRRKVVQPPNMINPSSIFTQEQLQDKSLQQGLTCLASMAAIIVR
ncbi:MAG: hypothetical protein ACO1QB_17535 [Verrucomicrobiales bacterium]